MRGSRRNGGGNKLIKNEKKNLSYWFRKGLQVPAEAMEVSGYGAHYESDKGAIGLALSFGDSPTELG